MLTLKMTKFNQNILTLLLQVFYLAGYESVSTMFIPSQIEELPVSSENLLRASEFSAEFPTLEC